MFDYNVFVLSLSSWSASIRVQLQLELPAHLCIHQTQFHLRSIVNYYYAASTITNSTLNNLTTHVHQLSSSGSCKTLPYRKHCNGQKQNIHSSQFYTLYNHTSPYVHLHTRSNAILFTLCCLNKINKRQQLPDNVGIIHWKLLINTNTKY